MGKLVESRPKNFTVSTFQRFVVSLHAFPIEQPFSVSCLTQKTLK